MQLQDSKTHDVQQNMVDAISNIGSGMLQLGSRPPEREPSIGHRYFGGRMADYVGDRREGMFCGPR